MQHVIGCPALGFRGGGWGCSVSSSNESRNVVCRHGLRKIGVWPWTCADDIFEGVKLGLLMTNGVFQTRNLTSYVDYSSE
jgi:hypothetical protein